MQWKNQILSLGLFVLSVLLWFIAIYLLLRT
jgi:hypothetical protein